jgi:Winged helix DNA-binding domain
MAERVLTERELNRALLARQLLLERAKTPLPRALERIGGIQAQYAPSMYIGLWSRLAGFERQQLTRALERRSVVQATLMRVTIHLVSRRDYWPLTLAVKKTRNDGWLKAHEGRVEPRKLTAAAKRLRPHLAKGPMSQKEVDVVLGGDAATRNGVGVLLDLVRVPPSGTWERRRADIYALAENWVGQPDVGADDALDVLVRRYLSGFGPATKNDIASWAGLRPPQIAPSLDRLEVRTFAAEDGKTLYDLPRAPLPHAETPAPVRFLPTWDATLLVHARAAQILPEKYRSRVFHVKVPQSVSTFIVDGQVAGTWRYDKGRIKLSPFHKLDTATRRELDVEAERLAALHS